ncbi:ABC-type nitrate/sulfonate/bicarbonate transport system, periplasmic components [Hahella chejuensis KCTC 2396]|uniref:ABC-type nitrate/sulfonate/bicarbonate transport system, periplasmic components n=1 Tax=Hahella chejuensis (strain KCTC 2396) TaxID=349521 RepID=Q2SB95_HAHCH|nr:putative urea ABC transporter substrate-binding protein [Hahella chejuensis]ABC32079.1 ABC-type nitrate/sulfonate/bicarbonate transport system, periplasmic components [Hahella chejuensis KCTC 2396]
MVRSIASIMMCLAVSASASAADKFKLAWSHYTGWEPWGYAADQGIVKKWADKYGIEIEVQLINDYVESINLYTASDFDAVTATNMDALTIPSVSGVDTQAIIVGDYSNGNDGIVVKGVHSVAELKGREINLVEFSVSHYMLARALDKNGMSERDVTVVNTSDADIASAFISSSKGAVVTWNPPLQQARNAKGAQMIFDSSMIPGEILDITFVKTNADERFKKALTGAWYETMAIISGGPGGKEAIEHMAEATGATVPEFKAQLRTTAMFYTPAEARDYTKSDAIEKTMEYVRQFSFDKGLFGATAQSADFVGIQFDNGKVLGDEKNVKLRFTSKYMEMAAQGSL